MNIRPAEGVCDEVVDKPFKDHEIFETMARLLDIKYFHKDMGEEVIEKERITLDGLSGIPLNDIVMQLDKYYADNPAQSNRHVIEVLYLEMALPNL